jgi:hypothetical protein
MGDYSELSRARVVDLTAYRTARARQRLPLLEEDSPAAGRPAPAARSLDARQVEHRERMLTHLGSSVTSATARR